MERPTDLIRRLLIVEALQESMNKELASIKEQMRANGLKITDSKNTPQDVWVQYVHHNKYEEATFMQKILDAESRNRAKRTGMIP